MKNSQATIENIQSIKKMMSHSKKNPKAVYDHGKQNLN